MSILQAWEGGAGLQPGPTWPHQLPRQPGSGPICLSIVLHSVTGLWLQECQSCGHKGPLCKQSQWAGGCGPAQHPKLALGRTGAKGTCMGQELPLAWPHSSQPGSAVSPLLQGLTGRKDPSPSSLPLQHQQPGGGSILHTPSARGPAPTPAQSWHHLGEPHHPYQGMAWPQLARKGSRRAGGQEHQAAAARFSFFQQLLSQRPQQGMCLGRGFQGPGHGVLNKLFIALTSLPGRNGQHSSCMGPGAWVPPVSSPPPPSQVPARWVGSPQRKDSWPPVISSPAISISSQCYAQSKICSKSCTPCGRDAQGPCPSSQHPCTLLNPLEP